MKPSEVKDLRIKLGLKQQQFGQLFGVHPITVSKWERGILAPSLYQQTLMEEFRAATRNEEVRQTLGKVLIGAGIAAALYLLLKNSQN